MPDIHASCRKEGKCKGPQVKSCLTASKEIQEAGRSRKGREASGRSLLSLLLRIWKASHDVLLKEMVDPS